MIATTVEQALARAHSALAMPTTYWLGGGGFEGAGPSALTDDGWVNTDSIHADAKWPQRMFVRLPQAELGALLVYPKDPQRKDHVGHIGIVTAIEAGRARVIHCAPENILIEPAPGSQRNAIAQTDSSHFDGEPATIAVWFKPLPR